MQNDERKIVPTDDPRYLALFSDDALIEALQGRHERVFVILSDAERFSYEYNPPGEEAAHGMLCRAQAMIEKTWRE